MIAGWNRQTRISCRRSLPHKAFVGRRPRSSGSRIPGSQPGSVRSGIPKIWGLYGLEPFRDGDIPSLPNHKILLNPAGDDLRKRVCVRVEWG